ncbi:thiol-disulfide oxidoreductase DCC family protein [Ferrimonas balearica]|uniref:thiol-disulfide oxidoreductase DCC family protein n=1 Tax=Ferrimonas balearica TaxID=44012 RepID=UPI001C991C2C|nr:DUF393 domain-containing protein [Ferrimonas balearica]MBY5920785.1 DUF393 domain-containing protein [Ferrimonas balearica]MBY5996530.1 DUF393 domain-containing protein [Ferrimonas balearica]
MHLTLFYDSHCPLCRREIDALRARDPLGRIRYVDLHDPKLTEQFPELDPTQAMAILHGRLADGTWLTGLDVTHQAWKLVGLGYLTAPLRWRPVRPVTDAAYRVFARHRHRLSYWLTGQRHCDRCHVDH